MPQHQKNRKDQILDPYTYQWDYQQGVKPTRVSMQEFLLSEKLFDPCTMTGADNGFTLAHQYRSALDNLTPSGAFIKYVHRHKYRFPTL